MDPYVWTATALALGALGALWWLHSRAVNAEQELRQVLGSGELRRLSLLPFGRDSALVLVVPQGRYRVKASEWRLRAPQLPLPGNLARMSYLAIAQGAGRLLEASDANFTPPGFCEKDELSAIVPPRTWPQRVPEY